MSIYRFLCFVVGLWRTFRTGMFGIPVDGCDYGADRVGDQISESRAARIHQRRARGNYYRTARTKTKPATSNKFGAGTERETMTFLNRTGLGIMLLGFEEVRAGLLQNYWGWQFSLWIGTPTVFIGYAMLVIDWDWAWTTLSAQARKGKSV